MNTCNKPPLMVKQMTSYGYHKTTSFLRVEKGKASYKAYDGTNSYRQSNMHAHLSEQSAPPWTLLPSVVNLLSLHCHQRNSFMTLLIGGRACLLNTIFVFSHKLLGIQKIYMFFWVVSTAYYLNVVASFRQRWPSEKKYHIMNGRLVDSAGNMAGVMAYARWSKIYNKEDVRKWIFHVLVNFSQKHLGNVTANKTSVPKHSAGCTRKWRSQRYP